MIELNSETDFVSRNEVYKPDPDPDLDLDPDPDPDLDHDAPT